MPTVVEQIPIRLQLSTASNPPVAPIDYNTGLAPQAWKTQTAAIQIGVFDAAGNPASLENMTTIQLLIQAGADATQALIVKQVTGDDITPLITTGAWRDGVIQNASFALSAADMDLSLLAAASREFWLVVIGYTEAGAPVILGGGPFTVSLASASLPVPAPRYTSRNAQTSTVGDMTVTPESAIHTEIITISGDARSVKCILGIAGVQDGSKLFVTTILPETPDITVSFRSGIGTNPEISTISTGSVLKALLQFYFDADAVAWVPEFYALPPT